MRAGQRDNERSRLPSVGQPFAKTRTATLVNGMTYSHCSQLLPIPQSRIAIPTPWPSLPLTASRSPPEQSVSLARSSPSRPLPHSVSTISPDPPEPNRHRFLLLHPLNPHYGTDSATSTPWHHFHPSLVRPLHLSTEPPRRTLSHHCSENSWRYRETFNVFSQACPIAFSILIVRDSSNSPYSSADRSRRKQPGNECARVTFYRANGARRTSTPTVTYSSTWRSCARERHRAHERASTYATRIINGSYRLLYTAGYTQAQECQISSNIQIRNLKGIA